MKIEISSYTEWKAEIADKAIPYFHYIRKGSYILSAIDGAVTYTHDLDVDDVADFEANYLAESNKKLGSFYSREPFAAKTLRDGSNLFRRKQGKKKTIAANTAATIIFTCPYGRAKINKLEIIGANSLDRVDLSVSSPVDPATASAYGMPANIMLNQFGFDVIVSDFLYSDKSDYDADVYAGFQIVIIYKNDTAIDTEVGFNLIFHEVVTQA